MAELHVNNVDENVQWYDPQSMLTPGALRTIVAAVTKEMEARDAHRERASAETQVNSGIAN